MAGGVLNHNFFWSILSPKSSEPSAAISEALNASFGNFDTFKTQFTESATKLFGSGWTWLVTNQQAPNSPLEIINLPNQENPIAHNKTVLLGIDLWEHAYYLKYQNRRPEYIDAFWNIVNWDQVNTIYQSLQ
jgi:Fe-Mn family superoxide dismutase